jgi:hypothetical protein
MDLNQAITLLKTAVKHTGTIDQKHIDLTIVPTDVRPKYERALVVTKLAMDAGTISKDELNRRLELD